MNISEHERAWTGLLETGVKSLFQKTNICFVMVWFLPEILAEFPEKKPLSSENLLNFMAFLKGFW
jgi:hypothetical protein